MAIRSVNITSDSSDSRSKQRERQAGGSILPTEIVQGIYRYTKLYGVVYSVYRETTKKYIGLALYDGEEFTPCTPTELIHAIHESKDGK